jgi:hypothetical protein
MFCLRCNKPVSGSGKPTKCGTSLHTLTFMKHLGWISVVAGAFVVILVTAIWIYIARQSAVPGAILCDLVTRGQFLSRIYVAFALIVVCGLLAIVDGIWQLCSGSTSWMLKVSIFTLFILGCVVGANGASACNPS